MQTKKKSSNISYKNILSLRGIGYNLNKLMKFKKEKWRTFLFHLKQREKKLNLFYRIFDQDIYVVPKFTSVFRRRFKQNLQNKRRLTFLYPGLSEKRLKRIVNYSLKKSSYSDNTFTAQSYVIENLESRLDIILLRSHFVLSVRNAQQLISHGHVYVNGLKVTAKNYVLNVGDIITFSQKIHNLLVVYISRSSIWPLPPKYLQVNYRIFQILVIERILYTNICLNFNTFLNLNSVLKKYKF